MMISFILDLIVPARRERRRQIKMVKGLFGKFCDQKRLEELLKKEEEERKRHTPSKE